MTGSAEVAAARLPRAVRVEERDADLLARRLAYVTVGVPTVGAVAAVWYSVRYGFTAVDMSLLAGMYLLTSFGVEGGLHRFFSHRAFAAGRSMTAFLAVTGSMAAQGPVLFWVATHRMHHAFTDTERDPHSPRPIGSGRLAPLRGFWHGHVGWLFTIRRNSWDKYVSDLLHDRLVMKTNQYYFVWVVAGLALPTAVGGLATWSLHGMVGGFLWGGLARIFVLDQVTWGVNSIGHTLGSRPNRTRDNSRNVAVMAPISLGGSWHNNHHAYPSLAETRFGFWQLDITGLLVRALDLAGVVSEVRYRKRS